MFHPIIPKCAGVARWAIKEPRPPRRLARDGRGRASVDTPCPRSAPLCDDRGNQLLHGSSGARAASKLGRCTSRKTCKIGRG